MANIYSNIIYDDQDSNNSGAEVTYALLWQTLYDTGIITKTMRENIAKEEVGTKSDFLKLYILSKLVRYLTLYQADINNNYCNTDHLQTLKESYNLKCVRRTMFCKYGLDKVFDNLLSKVVDPDILGIGAMTIGGRCNIFTVI